MNKIDIVVNGDGSWKWLYVNGKVKFGGVDIPLDVIASFTPIAEWRIHRLNRAYEYLPYSFKNVEIN